MTVTTVRQACTPSEIVWSDSLADQIAELSDLRDGRIDADKFFRRNHFTEGMERLLYNGFKRLSGKELLVLVWAIEQDRVSGDQGRAGAKPCAPR